MFIENDVVAVQTRSAKKNGEIRRLQNTKASIFALSFQYQQFTPLLELVQRVYVMVDLSLFCL